MSRARGANSALNVAFEAVYGTPPPSGFFAAPFVSHSLGEQQNLVENDVLGYGREPQAPSLDVITDDGDVVVPWDLRNSGIWLRAMFGAPTTAQGVAASGKYTFSAQPANNAVITVNGQAVTFVSGTPGANEVKIGATLADTVANAVKALNASAVAGVAAASYAASLNGAEILITHDTVGTGGNAFTTVAGSSPATNATASGATLAGGAATGPYNHKFQSGALNLPSMALEVGMPEVPRFGMNFGGCANTLGLPIARSGNLNATVGLYCQGETEYASSQAGTPTVLDLERFTHFTGQMEADGVPLADMVGGQININNGLDKVETIRRDGRIGGADAGMFTITGDIRFRFGNIRSQDMLAAAVAHQKVDLVMSWQIAAGKSCTLRIPAATLPRPKLAISGPGGVEATFSFQGSQAAGLGKSCIVTLVNDVSSYA